MSPLVTICLPHLRTGQVPPSGHRLRSGADVRQLRAFRSATTAAMTRPSRSSRSTTIPASPIGDTPTTLGQQGNWLWLIHNADTPRPASLHDDDVWQPDFLEKTVPVIDADPTVSMVFSDYELIDGDDRLLVDETEALTRQSHRDLLPVGPLDLSLPEALRLVAVWERRSPYCAVLRREAVVATEFPDAIDPVYDIWLSHQIARRGERFAPVPGRLTRYRWHPGSSTTTGWSAPEDEIFSRIICENSDAGEVIGEIEAYWASIRWGRRQVSHDGVARHPRCAADRVPGGLAPPAAGQAGAQRLRRSPTRRGRRCGLSALPATS